MKPGVWFCNRVLASQFKDSSKLIVKQYFNISLQALQDFVFQVNKFGLIVCWINISMYLATRVSSFSFPRKSKTDSEVRDWSYRVENSRFNGRWHRGLRVWKRNWWSSSSLSRSFAQSFTEYESTFLLFIDYLLVSYKGIDSILKIFIGGVFEIHWFDDIAVYAIITSDNDYVNKQHNAQKNPRGKREIIRFPGLPNRLPEIHGRCNLTTGDVMIHTTVQSQSLSWTLPWAIAWYCHCKSSLNCSNLRFWLPKHIIYHCFFTACCSLDTELWTFLISYWLL